MARWVAIFEDNAEADFGWVRRDHAEAHFAYLKQHAAQILIGGGFRNDPGEWYCGGMWVMEVDSREHAIALCENDPYFTLGLRKGYRLQIWGKAPCYGTVTL
jgi:uncharacterized protein YciI